MKKGKFIFMCMVFLPCLAGCAGREDKLAVHIYDRQTETRLDIREGITVRKALEEAEITLGDGDTVVPSLDTKVTGEEMDISIKRSEGMEKSDNMEIGKAKEGGNNINAKDKDTDKKQGIKETEEPEDEEPRIISKEKVYDCDGSGHGYYLIQWSDGREEYEDF